MRGSTVFPSKNNIFNNLHSTINTLIIDTFSQEIESVGN